MHNYKLKLLLILLLHPLLQLNASLYVESTFTTHYMSHGFDNGNNVESIQPVVAYQHPDFSKWTFKYWGNYAINRDEKSADEADVIIAYNDEFEITKDFKLGFNTFADYFRFYNLDLGTKTFDGVKFNVGVSTGDLFSIADKEILIAYNWYYWDGVYHNKFKSGLEQELSAEYALGIAGIEQDIHQKILLGYHHGAFNVDSGFSHFIYSSWVNFKIKEMNLKPQFNYQWSFEDTVNPEDELWLGLTTGFQF